MREIRTLRAMWRGLETTHGSDTEALSTETESKQSRPNLRSIGASPRPYRRLEMWRERCYIFRAPRCRMCTGLFLESDVDIAQLSWPC